MVVAKNGTKFGYREYMLIYKLALKPASVVQSSVTQLNNMPVMD